MHRHLRLRGKIYYATVIVDGVPTERSTGCTDEKAARAVLAGWERQAADPDHAAKKTTLNDALMLLVEDRRARAASGEGAAVTADFYQGKAAHLVRVLGHDFLIARMTDAQHITETVYAKVKDQDVGRRMLGAIDPRYARRTLGAGAEHKTVETIQHLPAPKSAASARLYAVDGVERTLADWARASGISKTTLHHRVVVRGMGMPEALALEQGTRGLPLPVELQGIPVELETRGQQVFRHPFDDCRAGAGDTSQKGDGLDDLDVQRSERSIENLAADAVRRDGIEPPTRGFSSACEGRPICKRSRRLGPFAGPTAAPVPQRWIRVVQPRTVGKGSESS